MHTLALLKSKAIHKCLDYAVRMGKISLNPSIMTEFPAKRKYQGAAVYTPEQLKTLLRLFRGEPLETAVQLAVTLWPAPLRSVWAPLGGDRL